MSVSKVVIIGGGISGLAAAFYLTEFQKKSHLPLEITVLESSPRFGGVIRTRRENGFLYESGPESFITTKPQALKLCQKLGLESELIRTRPEHRQSSIYFRGRLFPIPEGFFMMAPAKPQAILTVPFLSWKGKMRMACEPFIPPACGLTDESVGRFVERRFGRETLERLAEPMISGIYGGRIHDLSLMATFPDFRDLENRYGSIARGFYKRRKKGQGGTELKARGPRYEYFLTLKNGLTTLIDRLIESMPQVAFRVSSPVEDIRQNEKGWMIRLQSQESIHADAVCLAVPGVQAASVLNLQAPALAREIAAIPYESISTIHLAFRKSDLPASVTGCGFVAPRKEGRRVSSCSFSNFKFEGRAPEDVVLMRTFCRTPYQNTERDIPQGEVLIKSITQEMQKMLGIKAQPVWTSLHHQSVGTPSYHVGHLDRIRKIRELTSLHPGLFLTGNAYRGIGLSDCVRQAEEAAQRMSFFLDSSHKTPLAAGAR